MLDNIIEQQLEEEYKTLLKEIDYLVPAKSCILNFPNNNFNTKSSEDLTKLLKNYSKEVLETYIANHESHSKMAPLGNRKDLIHYVTEIIVSRPKCNHKLCKCILKKGTKQILLDTKLSTKNVKDIQARNPTKTAPQKANNLYQNRKVNTEIQTDDWKHDPNCTCGCCPKPSSHVIVKTAIEEKKKLQDAATSDKQIVFPNCTQTSPSEQNVRKCVPDNFESLLMNSKNQFSTCSAKQDCACDPYDVEEAIKLGLRLPARDICIQNNKGIVNKRRKSKKSIEYDFTTSENDSDSGTSYLLENERKTKKSQKKENRKKLRFVSNINTNSQKDETTTGCFGLRKKKKLCEKNCQGIIGHQRSIQTMPITRRDKSEKAYLYVENDSKAAETSTNSEIGTQMSAKHSEQTISEDKTTIKDEEIENKYIEISQSQTKSSKTAVQGDKQSQEAVTCDKCGRQRRDCHTACRNTIILPHGSRSGGALPAGEADSLRMLIKMQNKVNSQQFNNLMSELNSQKSEIRRLNSMYQKVVESHYESNKSTIKKNKPETFECGCSTFAPKQCGCSYDSECVNNNKDNGFHNNNCCSCSGEGKVRNKMANESKDAPKRFGPPNTAVAINMTMCSLSPDIEKYHLRTDGDQKQVKEEIRNKNTKYKNEGSGDSVSNSISTLFMSQRIQKITSFENIPQNIQHPLDKIDVIQRDDENPPENHPNKSTYSSKVLLWLQKPWINLKECGQKIQEPQEKIKEETNVLNFCQSAGKRAVERLWNIAKGKK